MLEEGIGQQVTVTDELLPTDDEGHLVLQPEAIIDTGRGSCGTGQSGNS